MLTLAHAPLALRAPAPIMSANKYASAAPSVTASTDGVVVPTNGIGGVKSWYDAGLRLTGEPVMAAPEPAAAPAEPEPPAPAPSRDAVWNPKGLTAFPMGPLGSLDLKELPQTVPEFLTAAPAYLDGSLTGDNGFDPLCLAAFADPNLDMDKTSRSASERKAIMSSMSAEEQASKVAWMRTAELKHARLAMLAAAGWPMAELTSGNWLKMVEGTNGRAPSLFNGGLFSPGALVFTGLVFGGLAALEVLKPDAKDGDYGFDPLGYSTGDSFLVKEFNLDISALPNYGDKEALQLAELKNGRAAMMAITGMAVQEFLYGNPVVEQTPMFFKFLGVF